MPKIFEYTLSTCLIQGQYLVMQSEHGLKVCSSYIIIQKSIAKPSQTLKICSARLLLSMFLGLFTSFLNLNPAL